MHGEISGETVQRVLNLPLPPGNDSGELTVRAYLVRLLADVWRDGEGFDGKRPFGNSSWEYDLYLPLIKAGLVKGYLDRDGYIEDVDDKTADRLIAAAIQSFGHAA